MLIQQQNPPSSSYSPSFSSNNVASASLSFINNIEVKDLKEGLVASSVDEIKNLLNSFKLTSSWSYLKLKYKIGPQMKNKTVMIK